MSKYKITAIPTISKGIITSVVLLCIIGFAMQYSAGEGVFNTYAYSYSIKLFLSAIIVIVLYKINVYNLLYKYVDIIYMATLLLLFLVLIIGVKRYGATRWINFKLFVVQPSEIIKVSLIFTLAKYFHTIANINTLSTIKLYWKPFLLSALPILLILKQPDLGTALIVSFIVINIVFISGFPVKYIIYIAGIIIMISPLIWLFMLKDYQKSRVLAF